MYLIYDPLNTRYKSVTGAAEVFLPQTFAVDSDADQVALLLTKEGENRVRYPMEKRDGHFEVTVTVTTVGLYRYCFEADGTLFFADNKLLPTTCGEKLWTLIVYERKYSAPEWLKGGVIYQIFPDRFNVGGERKKTKPGDMLYRDDRGGIPTFLPNEDGIVENRDMFGGNFRGITEKLGYLKSLGVTCIYLNPIFEAFSNHKYDTANYSLPDSDFGTLQDLSVLINEAQRKGIAIVLDGVFSHTGADSVYFDVKGRYGAGACSDPKSPYIGWYNFTDYPNKYDCWWGIEILPNVNENDPSFSRYITGEDGVIKRYMSMGIAGWRLDVADELPDAFLNRVTAAAKSVKKDALILGEVWENAATKYSYGSLRGYLWGGQLDSVTNYPLKQEILAFVRGGDASYLDDAVREQVNDYPPDTLAVLMNMIGTHDTPRALTVLGEYDEVRTKQQRSEAKIKNYEIAAKRLRLAAVLQYFLPGVPCVYYGDEAGMEGFEDPFNRKCYPWDAQDRALISFYKRLGRIRRQNKDLLSGGAYVCRAASGNVFSFERKGGEDKLCITVNVGDERIDLLDPVADLVTGRQVKHVNCLGFVIYRSKC